ncbi:probable splicing factor, arginine/serine-rich 7 isoform X3 [Aplysia californica]|uniref:Probable splicing factor, arginine/serine-rich 7 isoform X3 n=1 Tax=Aplysia californica TaxID=6500 RepID=A0ABM1A1U5_APLCA|nr:probable splicing factor, arginine/serine-rich 7 isoform X3 [Aplysia californica]
MSDRLETRVIQVTNVAPSCTKEQLRTLFSYLGRVKELQMYPPESIDASIVTARVAYIEFEDATTTGVALHLSSTVFVDRALMIVPVMDGKIPDESTALQLTPQAVAGMLPGQPTWPANVVSQVTGTGSNQVITTNDPRLTSLGLPQYPPLPASTDANVIEEIRRTVYVSDLEPKVTGEMLLNFFSQVGEIKYVRLAGDEHAGARAAYIEFTDQRSVAQALTYNNVVFKGRTMSVQHSKASIIKPQGKASEASQREIDEAMKKVKEAQKLISAAAAEPKKEDAQSPPRKRSRSKSKARSRSASRSRRSRSRSRGGRRRKSRSRSRRRSRSRHRSPRRSRTPVKRRRSRSRGRAGPPAPPVRRSRSRERRRSRTRSPVRRRRSRSRSRRKSRTPPRSYSKRSRSRSRKRSRSLSRKRSKSRDRRAKEKKKSPSLSPPRLERNGSIPTKDDDKDESFSKHDSSANVEEDNGKASAKKRSPSPVKPRRRSPSPRKRSRSRSPSRRTKRRRHTRSPSPKKRSRSRSGSRHKSKRDRSKRSRSRDRDRDRKHESKKKSTRDKDDKKKESSSSSKIKRDYDEEEKGFASGSEKEREASDSARAHSHSSSPPQLHSMEKDTDHQTVDMDMSD